jgi:hypothetical protein
MCLHFNNTHVFGLSKHTTHKLSSLLIVPLDILLVPGLLFEGSVRKPFALIPFIELIVCDNSSDLII